MTTIYISKIAMPICDFDKIHIAIYGYFPQTGVGERPYVWRVADGGKSVVVVSNIAPKTDYATCSVETGKSYAFALTYKRVRNCKGKPIEITDFAEMRARMTKWAADRGGQIGFVQMSKPRAIQFKKGGGHRVTLPIIDAHGTVYVTDAALFGTAIVGGGPGTGKAYGCGMWWLPELMEPSLASIANRQLVAA